MSPKTRWATGAKRQPASPHRRPSSVEKHDTHVGQQNKLGPHGPHGRLGQHAKTRRFSPPVSTRRQRHPLPTRKPLAATSATSAPRPPQRPVPSKPNPTACPRCGCVPRMHLYINGDRYQFLSQCLVVGRVVAVSPSMSFAVRIAGGDASGVVAFGGNS